MHALNGHWVVTGSSVTAMNETPEPLTLTFDDHELRLFAGCNHLWCAVDVGDATLRCEGICTTLMACDDERMQAEGALSDFIGERELSYALTDQALTLTSEDGRAVSLVRSSPTEDR